MTTQQKLLWIALCIGTPIVALVVISMFAPLLHVNDRNSAYAALFALVAAHVVGRKVYARLTEEPEVEAAPLKVAEPTEEQKQHHLANKVARLLQPAQGSNARANIAIWERLGVRGDRVPTLFSDSEGWLDFNKRGDLLLFFRVPTELMTSIKDEHLATKIQTYLRSNDATFAEVEWVITRPGEATLTLRKKPAEWISWDWAKHRDEPVWGQCKGFEIPLGFSVEEELIKLDISQGSSCNTLNVGAKGSGKSNAQNTWLCTLFHNNSPEAIEAYLVDAKFGVELGRFGKLPHVKRVVEDRDEVMPLLQNMLAEMERRYRAIREVDLQDWQQYNKKHPSKKFKLLLLVIDEYADLLMGQDKKTAKMIETMICRLAQLARASGISIFLSTQRPSAEIVSSDIKGNFDSRVCFRLIASGDYVTVLGQGAVPYDLSAGLGRGMWFDGIPRHHFQSTFIAGDDLNDELDLILAKWGTSPKNDLTESPTIDENTAADTTHPAGLKPLPNEAESEIKSVAENTTKNDAAEACVRELSGLVAVSGKFSAADWKVTLKKYNFSDSKWPKISDTLKLKGFAKLDRVQGVQVLQKYLDGWEDTVLELLR